MDRPNWKRWLRCVAAATIVLMTIGRLAGEEEPTTAPSEPALEEIERIRQRLQIDPLKGTMFDQERDEEQTETEPSTQDSAGDDEFSPALRRVWNERQAEPAQPATDANRPLRQAESEVSNDAELIESLREAARRLDRKANDLEQYRHYASADQLRDLADQLRLQARQYDLPEAQHRATGDPTGNSQRRKTEGARFQEARRRATPLEDRDHRRTKRRLRITARRTTPPRG